MHIQGSFRASQNFEIFDFLRGIGNSKQKTRWKIFICDFYDIILFTSAYHTSDNLLR